MFLIHKKLFFLLYTFVREISLFEKTVSQVSTAMSKQNEKYFIVTETLTFESFESISKTLRIFFPRIQNESDPLITLMTCRNRRFFLPVFYALVKLLKTTFFYNNQRLVSCLWKHVFEKHHNEDGLAWILLKNLETRIDLQLVENVSEKFTFDTIMYCAINGGQRFDWELEDEKVLTYDEIVLLRLRLWFEHVKEDLRCCSTAQEVEQIVQWIVKICFPSVTTTKNRVFIWDPFDETWCLVTELTDTLHIILKLIWNTMNEFMWNDIIKKNKKILYAQIEPEWLHVAKMMARQEKEKIFKIIEDIYRIRQKKHDKILKQFTIEQKSANVPELFFLEERSMKLIENNQLNISE